MGYCELIQESVSKMKKKRKKKKRVVNTSIKLIKLSNEFYKVNLSKLIIQVVDASLTERERERERERYIYRERQRGRENEIDRETEFAYLSITQTINNWYKSALQNTKLIDRSDSCLTWMYILNQIPNATSNTFLNNSKPTECRLISFKPWLDKCVLHSIVVFERAAWIHARAIAFCLTVPPFEKVTKKKAEKNPFQFSFDLLKCFVFVICRHFTTLKWLKVLRLSKSRFKMSRVKRICVFEHSVMTNFNCACPAIQRGQGSGFLSEGSSWFTACMSEQRRFWWDCADAQARLNLRCSYRL